jgi:hypothetical protein
VARCVALGCGRQPKRIRAQATSAIGGSIANLRIPGVTLDGKADSAVIAPGQTTETSLRIAMSTSGLVLLTVVEAPCQIQFWIVLVISAGDTPEDQPTFGGGNSRLRSPNLSANPSDPVKRESCELATHSSFAAGLEVDFKGMLRGTRWRW